MRRPERALGHQPCARRQEPRHRMNARGFKGLLQRHLRQDARQAPRQHGLAAARHAHHQHVMPARGGHFQCAARARLSAHAG